MTQTQYILEQLLWSMMSRVRSELQECAWQIEEDSNSLDADLLNVWCVSCDLHKTSFSISGQGTIECARAAT